MAMDNLRHKPDDPSKKIGRSKSLEDLSNAPSKKIGRSSSFDPYWSWKRLSDEETVRHSLTDEDRNVERGRQLGGGSKQRGTEHVDQTREVPDDTGLFMQWQVD